MTGDTYRCLEDGCGETFENKVKAGDHARREHMPAIGNYGIYDFIEIIPRRERTLQPATDQTDPEETTDS